MLLDTVILTDDTHVTPKQLDWYSLQVLLEDEMVADGLRKNGLNVARKSWSDPDFDWSTTRSILFRSTWDYFDRFDEFSHWLSQVEGKTELINSAKTIHWNLNKKYLLELEQKGINSVPSIVLNQGESHELLTLMKQQNWSQAIIKPLVSGTARHTYRLAETSLRELHKIQQTFNQLITNEGFVLQEFQPSICTQGEMSLIMIDGKLTHAVKKVAKKGDFRVQDDHGGTVTPYEPLPIEIQFAERVITQCDPKPIYARVDIINDIMNQPRLMELEMIEPELFFRFNRSSALQLAEAIKHHIECL